MEARTITRAEQALQGKTAGVQVLSASAKPGASPQVRIRGYKFNGSAIRCNVSGWTYCQRYWWY